jgi:hypothetical protein
MQDRRVKFVEDNTSVLVRLSDEQRAGLTPPNACSSPPATRIVPPYATSTRAALNKGFMRASKVYRDAVPGSMTVEAFVADLNTSTMRLAGLEEVTAGASTLAYGEGSHGIYSHN